MQNSEFPFTLDELTAAVEAAHEHTWTLPPEIRSEIVQEIGVLIAGMVEEYRVNFNPSSAIGRAVVSTMASASNWAWRSVGSVARTHPDR